MSAPIFKFRLYVIGNAPNSAKAVSNLTALCRRHLPDRHQIEVIDLMREPERALADGVLMTPTLVKVAPGAEIRIVGSLSDEPPIVASLGLNTVG